MLVGIFLLFSTFCSTLNLKLWPSGQNNMREVLEIAMFLFTLTFEYQYQHALTLFQLRRTTPAAALITAVELVSVLSPDTATILVSK